MNVSRRRYMGADSGEKPFEEQYFTLEALEAGTFMLKIPSGLSTSDLESISYSLDSGQTWTKTNNVNSTEVVITTPSVSAGDKVLWKGTGVRLASSTTVYCVFSASGLFNAYGNIMSLITDNFVEARSLTSSQHHFCRQLFNNNTYIVSAENLILPATTLSQRCYQRMFYQCTALEIAPALPSPKLVELCYSNMFNGCSALRYVKCLATDISGVNCLATWVSGVASTGTFVKEASMTTWPSGSSGIPMGWTVIDA